MSKGVPIGRFLLVQGRLLTAIWRWLRRGRRKMASEEQQFGYDRAQAPTTYAFICLVVIEGGVLHLLVPWPAVRAVALVAHLYLVVLLVGSIAAAKLRPHVVDRESIRVRHGGSFEVRVPRHLVDHVRVRTRSPGGELLDIAEDQLEVVVGGQTNVTIDLTGRIPVSTPLGRTGAVCRMHLYADDPRALARAIERRPEEGPA